MTKVFIAILMSAALASAQTVPTITVPGFEVSTVVSGLTMPTTMAFLGPNDFLVLEKNSGRVLRFRDGRLERDPVLDLSVNFASERGLLGIAVHPRFPTDRGVYLFWTCRSSAPGTAEAGPVEQVCDTSRMTGVEDTNNILAVPMRGNRVDRFTWDGEKLTFDRNIIMLRSFQADGASTPAGQNDDTQPPRGNHDAGVIEFGPDGKLYIYFGDQGRRGWMQNLRTGPTPPSGDDQFGGPEPDDNHLSGVILRLNADGSVPEDNPLRAPAALTGTAAENVRKVFAYGIRNGFGMTFDPFSGNLWISEHGDDTFDEINLVTRGMNGGWTQVIGPLSRLAEYRQIETTFFAPPEPFPSLQQWRWPPSRIATTEADARSRIVDLDGGAYSDPEFSWRWATLPGALGFAPRNFGPGMAGDLLVTVVGNPMAAVGYLMRFPVHMNRRVFEFNSTALADRVADNSAKYDLTESEPLIIGSGFGIATDMKLSPRNTLYVVSFSNGAIYEVSRTGPREAGEDDPDFSGLGAPLRATLNATAGGTSDGLPAGSVEIRLNSGRGLFCYEMNFQNAGNQSAVALRRTTDGVDSVALRLPGAAQGIAAGCIAASADLLRAIRSNPREFYVSADGQDQLNSAAVARLQ